MDQFRIRSAPRELPNGDQCVVTVSWESTAGQKPYLSITGEVYGRSTVRGEKTLFVNDTLYWMHSSGRICKEIEQAFPELVPFMKWHLMDVDGPLHYEANAVTFMEDMYGCSKYPTYYSVNCRLFFDSTVVFGAVEGDEFPYIVTSNDDGEPLSDEDLRGLISEKVRPWCQARKPALMAKFGQELKALKIVAESLSE